MYPYPPQRTQDDEPTAIDVRGVLPGQRPPVHAAALEEPTSEVPVILAAPEATAPEAAAPGAAQAGETGGEPQATDAAAATQAGETDGEPQARDAVGTVTDEATLAALPETDDDAAVIEATDAGHDSSGPDGDDIDLELSAETLAPQPADETETLVQSAYPTTPLADPLADETAPHATPATTPPVVGSFNAPPASGSRAPGEVAESRISLWSDEAVERLRGQWRGLQSEFIDDPEHAVNAAKALVTGAVQELADTLLDAQDSLDPFQSDGPVDTESMRVAMRRYREFLDRVLAL